MLLLLSPAKSLDFSPSTVSEYSSLLFGKEVKELVTEMQKWTVTDLQKLMKVSKKIATLNVERNQNFSFPFDLNNAKQALLAFNGGVYTGLDAASFSAKDMAFAQEHLAILSGLYGLLKPLDLIQPYRLEMGTKVERQNTKNLYEFWGNKITEAINQSGAKIIINLASQEYFKSVKTSLLQGDLYTISFQEKRNGVYKIISFSAKKARGMMTRYIIQNQLSEAVQIKAFDSDNYQFNEELSSEKSYTFTR